MKPMVKPSNSIADIPSKHTASATSRRLTTIENQSKASVHHLVMLLMFLLFMKMALFMMMFAAVKNQSKTSLHHLVHDGGDTDSDDVDVDVGG